MNKILILLTFITLVPVYGQVNKQLDKIFTFDYVQLKPQSSYSNLIPSKIKHDSSLSQKGDTTGIHNGIEYLQFRDEIAQESASEILKLLRIDWVKNQEYDAFCDWVLDSLYREKVYANTNPTGNDQFSDEDIAQLLAHSKFYQDINGNDSSLFDPSKPDINREIYLFDYNFNWEKRLRYSSCFSLITPFQLQPNERFYKRKDLDERKWYFKQPMIDHEMIIIARDREIWAKKSIHPYDIYYNLANHYYQDVAFKDKPVQGLLGNQAKAFLIYLEQSYQKQINVKKLPFRIRLTLPNNEDLRGVDPDNQTEPTFINIEETDMTEHWRITNKEYAVFLDAVRDSILRETIYANLDLIGDLYYKEQLKAEFLVHPDVYYDEVNLEWKEFDPSEPYINRSLFPFDYSFNWAKKIPKPAYLKIINRFFKTNEDSTELNLNKFIYSSYRYNYYWQDLKRKANIGEFLWFEPDRDHDYSQYYGVNWGKISNHRDLDLGNGIRRSEDYSSYIIEEVVGVYPRINYRQCTVLCEHAQDNYILPERYAECPNSDNVSHNVSSYDFESNPDELVHGISYQQALAYYNWKFLNKDKRIDFDEIIFDELLPNQSEFERIQRGEHVIKKSEKVNYPTPAFRYVIHIYKA